mmetsp:Transcript_74216/g.143684  ORF Transcript_74216/g.143684 Transcript_74216/m.143684 type:complete len:218 (-) Transcript_74216:46-699(-)
MGNRQGQQKMEAGAGHNQMVDDDDMALLDIKAQRDQIQGQRRRLHAQLLRDDDAARTLVRNGKKPQAMLALRTKKLHQQLADECEQHLLRLEELIEQVEMARMQRDTVQALSLGTATLRRIQKEIGGVDRVQTILDESHDAVADQQELSEALSGAGILDSDTEALAELARLEAEVARASGAADPVPAQPVLAPEAPAPASSWPTPLHPMPEAVPTAA